MPDPSETLISLTTQIISAHVSHNDVPPEQLPRLIKQVFDTLGDVSREQPPAPEEPAVPLRQSLYEDSIICLNCGQSYKMLKRHLMTDHGLSPDEYRQKWKLPYDYPMVAPSYAEVRSNLAKESGLGTHHLARRKTRRRA